MEHVAATVSDAMKAVLMIGDIRLKEEQIGVAGDIYILDASVATPQNFAQHFAKFTPALLKKFFICVQVSRYSPFGSSVGYYISEKFPGSSCRYLLRLFADSCI